VLAACNSSNDKANSINKQFIKTDSMTYPVKNISVSINRPANEVYQFTSNPENFPKWVEFVKSITKQGEIWIGKTNNGDIKIKFAAPNNFGVIDHQVTLPDGVTVNNPMRVIANNKGSEFTFTLFWLPNRTEDEFNKDAKAVTGDLQKLKEIMEHK
jgi:hypothetical protein